jgi:sporulation protein YlmC with PRC-barrel domain
VSITEVTVARPTEFVLGTDVSCTDGDCGELRRVVVDPVAGRVTHLVVEAKHREGLGRLVPLAIVDFSTHGIRLLSTKAEFEKLPFAEETHFLPGSEGDPELDTGDQALLWPYFAGNLALPVTDAALPVGEVEVHRGERVHASDGEIGEVRGLVIDASSQRVTHVLLQEGHLWGRKQIAIPIGAVTRVDDGVRLNLTKEEVRDLPPVDVDTTG